MENREGNRIEYWVKKLRKSRNPWQAELTMIGELIDGRTEIFNSLPGATVDTFLRHDSQILLWRPDCLPAGITDRVRVFSDDAMQSSKTLIRLHHVMHDHSANFWSCAMRILRSASHDTYRALYDQI